MNNHRNRSGEKFRATQPDDKRSKVWQESYSRDQLYDRVGRPLPKGATAEELSRPQPIRKTVKRK